MNRKVLTYIISVWQANLITRMEYQMALGFAIRGKAGDPLVQALRRCEELKSAGIVG